MERISNKSPCLDCCSDRQIGNPDVWQSDCYRCQKLPNWKAKVIDRLAEIEDILGDDYDLDRLKELVEADKEGRCVALPCKAGDTINAFRFQDDRGIYCVSDKVTSVSWNKNGYTVRTKEKFYPIKEKDGYDFAPIEKYPYALADFYIGEEEVTKAALKRMKGENK